MDVLYRRGRATVAEILASIPDPPSYSAVRAMLRVLEHKKHIRHQAEDLRYVYLPVVPREKARRSAVTHLLDTFFDGSTEQAVATLLKLSARDLKPEDFDRLAALSEDWADHFNEETRPSSNRVEEEMGWAHPVTDVQPAHRVAAVAGAGWYLVLEFTPQCLH